MLHDIQSPIKIYAMRFALLALFYYVNLHGTPCLMYIAHTFIHMLQIINKCKSFFLFVLKKIKCTI